MTCALQCQGHTRGGRRCRAIPLRGDFWCAWHVPERVGHRRVVPLWGGPGDGLEFVPYDLGEWRLVLHVHATQRAGRASGPVVLSDTVRRDDLVPGGYVLEAYDGPAGPGFRYRWLASEALPSWARP